MLKIVITCEALGYRKEENLSLSPTSRPKKIVLFADPKTGGERQYLLVEREDDGSEEFWILEVADPDDYGSPYWSPLQKLTIGAGRHAEFYIMDYFVRADCIVESSNQST